MSLRSVSPGYLYILSNDFPSHEMITINKSKMPPGPFLKSINSQREGSKWVLSRPTEILYEVYLDNCNFVEGKIHEFLISQGFCGGGPKDYQLSLKDGIFIVETILGHKFLDPQWVLPKISHTQILPEEGCNYHLLGHLFNGTYGRKNGEIDPYQRDQSVGFHCFKRGANQGDERCFNDLGLCYEHGMGTEPNWDHALDCFRQVFALEPCKGVNGLFRLFLRKNEPLRAGGIVENFLEYCDQSADENVPRLGTKASMSENAIVQQVLDGHREFVRILANFLVDCYRIQGEWDILSGYTDVFEEFSFSIKSHLETESNFLKENHFDEMAADVEKCLVLFDGFLNAAKSATG